MGSWWCRFSCESSRCLCFCILKSAFFSPSSQARFPAKLWTRSCGGPPSRGVCQLWAAVGEKRKLQFLYVSAVPVLLRRISSVHCVFLFIFFCSAPLVLFSGGMPRASYGDRHCLTILQDSTHVTLDFTSRVIDFFTIHCTSRDTGVWFSS